MNKIKFAGGHTVHTNEASQTILTDDSGEISILDPSKEIILDVDIVMAFIPVEGGKTPAPLDEALWLAGHEDMEIRVDKDTRFYKVIFTEEGVIEKSER